MDRAVREALIHGDMLMVLVGVLEDSVRSECRLNTLWVKLLLEKLRRMMLESKPKARLQVENWDEWREQLMARRSKMLLLREAVESISKMHYDGQALLFAEDENKLNQTIDMLEEVVGIYNIFENGRTELKRINTDAVADALEAIVEYFEVTARR